MSDFLDRGQLDLGISYDATAARLPSRLHPIRRWRRRRWLRTLPYSELLRELTGG